MSDSVTPWIVAHEVLLSVGFSRQEYWSGLPFSSPGDLPDPGSKPSALVSPALASRFFTAQAYLLLIIIYVFVGIKIIVTCFACICKWAAKIVSRVMPQTQIYIFHSKNEAAHANMRELQKMDHCSFVVQLLCLTLCDPIDCRSPGFPVLHYLPELAQTHAHWVDDAIWPSSVVPFSSCPQFSPASGSFPMNQLFASGG